MRFRELAAQAVVAITVCACMADVIGAAQRPQPREADVKAVYLLNFGRFTSWPAGAAAGSFMVCVLGGDDLGHALTTAVAGEMIDGKPVVSRAITRVEDAAACRVLFISGKENRRLKQILDELDGARTLTVSDIGNFVEQGGMIQFVAEGNRVRFVVNVPAAERVGLAFSSELLRVAVSVKTSRTP